MSPLAQIYLDINAIKFYIFVPDPSLLATPITRSLSPTRPARGSWYMWPHVSPWPLTTAPSSGPLAGTRGTCPRECAGTLTMTRTWFCRGKEASYRILSRWEYFQLRWCRVHVSWRRVSTRVPRVWWPASVRRRGWWARLWPRPVPDLQPVHPQPPAHTRGQQPRACQYLCQHHQHRQR